MMRPHVGAINVSKYLHFYLTDEYVGSNDPGKPTRCENGKPSTVCLSHQHNGERGEEHQVVWFCQEVNNGFHNLQLS